MLTDGLGLFEERDRLSAGAPHPGFTITPELAAAAGQGFALFQKKTPTTVRGQAQFGDNPGPVLPLFDSVTLFFEVGVLKPDPEIFRDALEKIALPPEAVAFIDDVRENIDAASALGIRGIQYKGHAELLEALAKFGVVQNQNKSSTKG